MLRWASAPRPTSFYGGGLRESGYSLVELCVVVAVIGVLVVVGMATFAGASERAEGRAVEVELRGALEAALIVALESDGRFVVDGAPMTPADLQAEEPAYTFGDVGTSTVIGVSVADGERTIRLEKLDEHATRHTLVAVSGLGMRFCADVEPVECALEVDEAVEDVVSSSSPSSSTTTTTVAASNGRGRQDGTTPAADRRQNGR